MCRGRIEAPMRGGSGANGPVARSPQPLCRGRIEAATFVCSTGDTSSSPQPLCRGRIEAWGRYGWPKSSAVCLHSLCAVAELKQARPCPHVSHERRLHSLCAVAELKHAGVGDRRRSRRGLHSLCAVAELKQQRQLRVQPPPSVVSTAFVPWPN